MLDIVSLGGLGLGDFIILNIILGFVGRLGIRIGYDLRFKPWLIILDIRANLA